MYGLSRADLALELEAMRLRPFRANQVWKWLYLHGAKSFHDMTDVGKEDRSRLEGRFEIAQRGGEDTSGLSRHCSRDGTEKWRISTDDGRAIESVYIPGGIDDGNGDAAVESNRGALCISSQVGCTLSCKFCHTGTMDKKLLRNLSTWEIMSQLATVKRELGDWDLDDQFKSRKITHIVFMGMGEPLYNFRNVKSAIEIMLDMDGLNLSRRKITLSTAGVVPGIKKLAEADLRVSLAISLHAVDCELRSKIMDVNKRFPVASLLDACVEYGSKSSQRITFEYVLLEGVNDSDEHARELADTLIGRGIYSFVNLIPFNPWPGSFFVPPSNNRVRKFLEILEATDTNLLRAAVRWPRGRDIGAACGQLATTAQDAV